jgi:hypothetical protein
VTTTIAGNGWSAKVPDELAQDMKDGAALRRLREALPRRVRIEVILDVIQFASNVVVKTTGTDYDYVAMGRTIGEAADECREALKSDKSGDIGASTHE